VLLAVRREKIESLLDRHAFIVQVNWDGRTESAQISEVQLDALGEQIQHVDFLRISLRETVTVSVPIELHGEAAGVTAGGVLDVRQHSLEVECLPTAIPERLRVEISGLQIGDSLRVADIQFPEGTRPVGEPELVVVTVAAPSEVEEEAEAPPEELRAGPEVIGREVAKEEAGGEAESGPEN